MSWGNQPIFELWVLKPLQPELLGVKFFCTLRRRFSGRWSVSFSWVSDLSESNSDRSSSLIFLLLSVLSLSHIVNSFISHSITDMTRITAVQLSHVYGRAEHFPKIRGSGAGKELKKNKALGSVVRRSDSAIHWIAIFSNFIKLAVDQYNLRLRLGIYKLKFLRFIVGSRSVVSQLFG